jgi:hypothetical protein
MDCINTLVLTFPPFNSWFFPNYQGDYQEHQTTPLARLLHQQAVGTAGMMSVSHHRLPFLTIGEAYACMLFRNCPISASAAMARQVISTAS